jgi:hypothetical protein
MQCSLTHCKFAKRAHITFGAVAKVDLFVYFAHGNRKFHATQIMLCKAAERTISNILNWKLGLKFCVPSMIIRVRHGSVRVWRGSVRVRRGSVGFDVAQ